MTAATAELGRLLQRQRTRIAEQEAEGDPGCDSEDTVIARLRADVSRLELEAQTHWQARQAAERELQELRQENLELQRRCEDLEAALGGRLDPAGPAEEEEEEEPVEQVQGAIEKLEETLLLLQQKSAEFEAQQARRHEQLATVQAQIDCP
eukprot:CAMPEP_0175308748 /NCGR_PEP_ID=MMETSP0093-20121207/65450_1 /TAXON_ID=311494 /ORGANISM="Alexandrium monilatum, Strain CCMP3105" /LENGTH=150 /DNA_ID=CAMNT_0016605277 /DNA_START=17 /DNA_END=466 /DNA_ORIENTATION=+